MRAADHQFQQPLVVGVMDRQGTPGVKFDVEGSGYGFRVIGRSPPAQAEMPHSLQDGPASSLHTDDAACAKTIHRTSKNPRSAKSPTPAWGAATCWRSGSAKATRSRPSSSAQAAIDSLQQRRDLLRPQPRPARAARGHRRLHERAARPASAAERIAVTSGGVNALMLAVQALVDAGDEVVAVTPVWPNLTAQPLIMGAKLQARVAASREGGAWTLDLQALLDAITPATKLLIVNAPNNPTGWTLTRDEQQAILEHCRKTGTWILADEVYERLYYEPTRQRLRAQLPRRGRAGRPAGRGAQLLQELPDDRLAPGLAGDAAGA